MTVPRSTYRFSAMDTALLAMTTTSPSWSAVPVRGRTSMMVPARSSPIWSSGTVPGRRPRSRRSGGEGAVIGGLLRMGGGEVSGPLPGGAVLLEGQPVADAPKVVRPQGGPAATPARTEPRSRRSVMWAGRRWSGPAACATAVVRSPTAVPRVSVTPCRGRGARRGAHDVGHRGRAGGERLQGPLGLRRECRAGSRTAAVGLPDHT